MATEGYIGVDGVARKVTKAYIGVDGVARKVTKAYIGVDGVARLCYEAAKRISGTATHYNGELKAYITIDGIDYGKTSGESFNVLVPKGTIIKCSLIGFRVNSNYLGGVVYINGKKVFEGADTKWSIYEYTVVTNVTITIATEKALNGTFGRIDITEY